MNEPKKPRKKRKPVTPEFRELMRQRTKEHFANGGKHGMSGKKHTGTTKQKISKSKTGIPLSQEHKDSISQTLQGVEKPPHVLEKMREGHKKWAASPKKLLPEPEV